VHRGKDYELHVCSGRADPKAEKSANLKGFGAINGNLHLQLGTLITLSDKSKKVYAQLLLSYYHTSRQEFGPSVEVRIIFVIWDRRWRSFLMSRSA